MRGFKKITEFLDDESILLPVRATSKSAGYDLAIIEDKEIAPGEVYLAPTGLKAFMNCDEVLKLYPRSSLAVKRGLTIPNNVGIIDADYFDNDKNEGHIFVALYNFSNKVVKLEKGERVAQGIFVKYLTIDNEEEVTEKRTGGFGSTK